MVKGMVKEEIIIICPHCEGDHVYRNIKEQAKTKMVSRDIDVKTRHVYSLPLRFVKATSKNS